MMEELPDIAILDYWIGISCMLFASFCFLFESIAIIVGIPMYLLGISMLFGLKPAEYLIERVDSEGEIIESRLYRPTIWKPIIWNDEILSGPYEGLELELLKQDLE